MKYYIRIFDKTFQINKAFSDCLVSHDDFQQYMQESSLTSIITTSNINYINFSVSNNRYFVSLFGEKKLRVKESVYKELRTLSTLDPQSKSTPVFVDFFCGAGAGALAIRKLGIQHGLSIDSCPDSERIFTNNFPKSHKFLRKDIKKINMDQIPNHDLMFASIPTQTGTTSTHCKSLDHYLLNIVKVKKPKIIVLELPEYFGGNNTSKYLTSLREIGYFTESKVLDAFELTKIPHRNRKKFIFGFVSENSRNDFKKNDFLKNYSHDSFLSLLEPLVRRFYYITAHSRNLALFNSKVINY